MKIMVTILSFFILSLSVSPNLLPTSDDCGTEQLTSDHEDSPCASDCESKCSPFYSCGSCLFFPLHFQIHSIIFKSKIATQIHSPNFHYQFHGKESFSNRIWQPPQ